ncbi:MAG: hypothetical protein ACP5QK_13370, partial [Myxococcota bacterium]
WLSRANISIVKEYIEEGLKDHDEWTVYGAMGACWMVYGNDCIPKIERVLDDFTKGQQIKEMARKFIFSILNGDPPGKDFLAENPIDYGE